MEVFDYDRLSLLDHLPKEGVCAEIGVWTGEYSQYIIMRNSPKKLYLIDMWDVPSMATDNDRQYYKNYNKTEQFLSEYQGVKNRFSSFNNVELVRSDSAKAAEMFEDDYFDWVYIDADHSYECVLKDLRAYYPKVKKDGYICGHDWDMPDPVLNAAVLDFVEETGIEFVGITNEKNWSSYVLKKS
jgi:hypothetical protein